MTNAVYSCWCFFDGARVGGGKGEVEKGGGGEQGPIICCFEEGGRVSGGGCG